ncbi:hypothetical protein [Aequorivita lipolytica]|uniref:Uncharacterized protein n=1 Tax=Aequorivita lipolytica TaxID=153267 RepID=A0A5C6YMC8_9FLAO|nr:hypothetical protein [Aequorivita lipolytica]TXD68419.1 hypothetical protein ESV24_12120 [Aequorivita lipolytica]SRX51437.1 hypothetical protein AEQU2_01920 [Aequorivita lipolytica]
MNITLKELKNINSESCITIILNTHRTSPDSAKDAITLKNLCKQAEDRLLVDEDKRDAKNLIKRMHELTSQIDHNYNLESLVLFVNENIAEYTRLPISVEDRVIIDNTFATRDLIRALHQEANYLILLLSHHKVRLIEAFNGKVVKEYDDSFPMENSQFYSTNKVELSNASRQTNLIAEFFNRVDKEVNNIRNENPLPVLICSEESNYHEYLKIADQKQSIFEAYLNKNRLDEKAHQIVEHAWEIVKKLTVEKNNSRKQELLNAQNSDKFFSDINDIYRAILEGKVQTLFLEEGLFQPGIIDGNSISFVTEEERTKKSVTDDIYDELIEANMKFGGDTVFLPKGELADFNGFVAITRY